MNMYFYKQVQKEQDPFGSTLYVGVYCTIFYYSHCFLSTESMYEHVNCSTFQKEQYVLLLGQNYFKTQDSFGYRGTTFSDSIKTFIGGNVLCCLCNDPVVKLLLPNRLLSDFVLLTWNMMT